MIEQRQGTHTIIIISGWLHPPIGPNARYDMIHVCIQRSGSTGVCVVYTTSWQRV